MRFYVEYVTHEGDPRNNWRSWLTGEEVLRLTFTGVRLDQLEPVILHPDFRVFTWETAEGVTRITKESTDAR